MAKKGTAVGLEVGTKRVFAWAFDWPGWCRSGKDEELALEALATYVPRYAVVAERAGLRFPKSVGDVFDVRERLPGSASTEFGVPGAVGDSDTAQVLAADAARIAKLLTAAWAVLDEVAAGAPAELRKGPRGGGRDRDKMLDHVVGSEAGYARQIGVRHKPPAFDDAKAIAALRADILAVLGQPAAGPAHQPKGWPPRYAARRIAWHALDHAWEMQDRSDVPPE